MKMLFIRFLVYLVSALKYTRTLQAEKEPCFQRTHIMHVVIFWYGRVFALKVRAGKCAIQRFRGGCWGGHLASREGFRSRMFPYFQVFSVPPTSLSDEKDLERPGH